jgi:CheY-like chemotaxis protein
VIGVTDTGCGMPPAHVAKAFDPFFTTKEVGKGTGLGLSQVYGFVRQSSGDVKIHSEIGRGTTLKLYLHRYRGAPGRETENSAADENPMLLGSAEEIVLVVEDDELVREMSVSALRELGYVVHEAGTGARALQMLGELPRIDLLFTDIVMPGMTGRQLAERASSRWPGLKVLYTTGYTRNAVVQSGTVDADGAFLTKPFSITELAEKVRAVLDGRAAYSASPTS